MQTIENVVQLCQDARSLVERTKIAKDTDFLIELFDKLNRNKIDVIPCIKVLGPAYSVARTTNVKTKQTQLQKLLGQSRPIFEQYDIASPNPISSDLQNLFRDMTCGSSKNGNTIVSLISKFGYFVTGRCFPICDTYAKKNLSILAKKLGLKKTRTDTELSFFDVYARLLQTLGKDKSFIPCTDAFLWLYGSMQSLEKNANTGTEADWWNKTCGFIGDPEFLGWYAKAKQLMQ